MGSLRQRLKQAKEKTDTPESGSPALAVEERSEHNVIMVPGLRLKGLLWEVLLLSGRCFPGRQGVSGSCA